MQSKPRSNNSHPLRKTAGARRSVYYGFAFPPGSLADGVYWIEEWKLHGGFTVAEGRVTRIADVLRSVNFNKFLHKARRIG